MLIKEEGPWFALQRLREFMGIKYDDFGNPVEWPPNSVFTCIYCMSVWVGMALLGLPLVVVLPFAVSAVAILVSRLTD